MNSINRVVIFGATSAIAEQTARLLVRQGASIYCVARNPERLAEIINDLRTRAGNTQIIDGISADLTQTEQHEALINTACQTLGGLDAALVAHGSLPDQSICESSVEKTLNEINTNALSVISLLTLLANHFESQQQGVIAAISSVAGDRGRQSNYVYGAAKGMVSLFLQGLRNRLHRNNVRVVAIKPGFVDTPMTAGFDKKGPLWAKPENIAQGIVQAMNKGKGDVYLPGFWRLIMLVIKNIPDIIFRRLSL